MTTNPGENLPSHNSAPSSHAITGGDARLYPLLMSINERLEKFPPPPKGQEYLMLTHAANGYTIIKSKKELVYLRDTSVKKYDLWIEADMPGYYIVENKFHKRQITLGLQLSTCLKILLDATCCAVGFIHENILAAELSIGEKSVKSVICRLRAELEDKTKNKGPDYYIGLKPYKNLPNTYYVNPGVKFCLIIRRYFPTIISSG